MSPTMKAIWSTKEGRTLIDLPIPTPAANEVLIKNVAVASNPKDWKMPLFIPGYESVEGNDTAGIVEAVGEGVSDFKKGDKVAAFTKMRTDQKYGIYAEYSVSPANTVFHLGPKSSFEDAAALPLAYMTAVIGLFKRLGLPDPDSADIASPPTPILIWGASSTVGVYAVQLAKLAGLYVVGIAGSNVAHAKSYGADEVHDYRGKSTAELAAIIHNAAGGKIRHVYDAIAENGTFPAIVEGLQPEGGKVTAVLDYTKDELASLPSNIHYQRTFVGTAHDVDADYAKKWFARAGEWLEEEKLRPQTVKVIPGGLEGVDEGIQSLQDFKVNAVKLVYRLAETPGL